MAIHVPNAPGFATMLKEGARHFVGLEEAVFRNISACKEFGQTLKTTYGPQGQNKMVINHLEKLFVTNDAATIIGELEVEHPAAKLMVLASQMQEQEVGDGTNWVIIFIASLLQASTDLLRMGLTPTDVSQGYQLALEKALEILPSLTCWEIKDPRDLDQVVVAMKTSLGSKQYGYEDFLANLVAKACIAVLSDAHTFNVDNVRVCKLLGGGVTNSEVVQGMVFKRSTEGAVTRKENAKIVVYSCPFDIATTETKGTVLIKSAEELTKFSRGEEQQLEVIVKAIAEAGVDVVAAGGKIGDLALHYLNKYNIMAVRVTSKWDLRRLCRTVSALVQPKLTCPTKDELGFCDKVFVDEIGDTSVIIFRQESKDSRISTVVIRGSTENYMDDIERAVNDGINTYKGICRDGRFVAGAGGVEMELSLKIKEYGTQCPGLEQYAIQNFAEALQIFPKVLAENCGVSGQETLSNLLAAHADGKTTFGFDCEGDGAAVMDAKEKNILDLYLNKYWALKYSTLAACQILCVDEIIMAKKAGGPKPKGVGPQDPDDD